MVFWQILADIGAKREAIYLFRYCTVASAPAPAGGAKAAASTAWRCIRGEISTPPPAGAR